MPLDPHKILKGTCRYKQAQDRKRHGGWRPPMPLRGADTSPRCSAPAAPPSRRHMDLKPTLPPRSCPSSTIGRDSPHLCPIEWLLPESELGIGPTVVSFRAARDVIGVWHPCLFCFLTGIKGAAGKTRVSLQRRFYVTFNIF